VFLVMMIIFMLSALAVQAEANNDKKKAQEVSEQLDAEKRSGLNVSLPTGAAQEIDVSKASLVLVIPVEGDLAVDGKLVRDVDLDNLFRAAFVKDKTRRWCCRPTRARCTAAWSTSWSEPRPRA
jgi:biopolymer transport protein ExbD